MCGRYYIDDETSREIEKILKDIDKKNTGKQYKTGEIFPTDTVPILVAKGENIEPDVLTWGFPKYQQKGVVINAKSDTIFEKRMFSQSIQSRRCIVPATGFYEWNKNKEKIFFTQPGSSIMYIAGVYNFFNEDGRFVIITTNGNESMKNVHDRMPLILPQGQLQTWLFEPDQTQNILNQVPTLLNKKSDYEQITLNLD